jgi:hypothetical protein
MAGEGLTLLVAKMDTVVAKVDRFILLLRNAVLPLGITAFFMGFSYLPFLELGWRGLRR